jgi:hypothetical protein
MGYCEQQYKHVRVGIFLSAALFFSCISETLVMAESGPFHLRIGFSSASFVSAPKDDIKVAVQVLAQKIARKTVGSADSRIYESIEDIERDLKTKKLDVVALAPRVPATQESYVAGTCHGDCIR